MQKYPCTRYWTQSCSWCVHKSVNRNKLLIVEHFSTQGALYNTPHSLTQAYKHFIYVKVFLCHTRLLHVLLHYAHESSLRPLFSFSLAASYSISFAYYIHLSFCTWPNHLSLVYLSPHLSNWTVPVINSFIPASCLFISATLSVYSFTFPLASLSFAHKKFKGRL